VADKVAKNEVSPVCRMNGMGDGKKKEKKAREMEKVRAGTFVNWFVTGRGHSHTFYRQSSGGSQAGAAEIS
jgi:hypothetical protein